MLQSEGCASFSINHLDDIIIGPQTEEEHVQHIKLVLSALTSRKLTIQEKKCTFFAERMPVLGYWLEIGGIRPNLSRLCNMLEWDRPTTRKTLLIYLGIVNFFRRFVPDIETILKPIRDIKEKTFDWYMQPGAEVAYQKIYKKLVLEGPFLHFPAPGVQLELATDASVHAMGAILFQLVQGEIKVIGYNSKKFSKSELAYSVPKKELIAVLYHCRYYKHYLWQREFKNTH